MKNIDQLQYIYLNIIRFLSMMKRGERIYGMDECH